MLKDMTTTQLKVIINTTKSAGYRELAESELESRNTVSTDDIDMLALLQGE